MRPRMSGVLHGIASHHRFTMGLLSSLPLQMDRLEREIAKGNERSQLNQLRDRDMSAGAPVGGVDSPSAAAEPADGSVAPSQAPSRSRMPSAGPRARKHPPSARGDEAARGCWAIDVSAN